MPIVRRPEDFEPMYSFTQVIIRQSSERCTRPKLLQTHDCPWGSRVSKVRVRVGIRISIRIRVSLVLVIRWAQDFLMSRP